MGKEHFEPVEGRLCALFLVLLLRLLLLLAGLAVVCVAVVLSASKMPASGTFGALAVVVVAVAIGNVGAVKRESLLSGAAGQSRAAAPARSSSPPRLVSGGSGSSVKRETRTAVGSGGGVYDYQDTTRVSVGCMDDVCCVMQDLHCKFSTVPQSLELTPPLPASSYAIPMLATSSSVGATTPLVTRLPVVVVVVAEVLAPLTPWIERPFPLLLTAAPTPVHPPNHVLRMALLLANLTASSTLLLHRFTAECFGKITGVVNAQ